MDPSHVGFWVCGWFDQYVGRPNAMENDLGHCEGDGVELGEGEVVNRLTVFTRWLDREESNGLWDVMRK